MATIRRFDRYTERGPYIAWLSKVNEGEYTIAVQIGGHAPESDDEDLFETEDQALKAADVIAHRLQQ